MSGTARLRTPSHMSVEHLEDKRSMSDMLTRGLHTESSQTCVALAARCNLNLVSLVTFYLNDLME